MFTIRALKSRKAVWNPIAERPFFGTGVVADRTALQRRQLNRLKAV
jgi:hypothetical protein